MKKQILLPFLLLCIGITAQQTRFGVKTGYSLSTLSVKSDIGKLSYDPKSSFYIGGLVEHNLNDKFSLQAELLYSNLGGTFNATSTDVGTSTVEVEDKTTFGTLQVPLLGKYNVTNNLALAAGVNFGAIISAKSNYKDSSGVEKETDFKENVNTFNIAPLIGLEYNLENKMFVDARYNFGISNISKIASKETISFLQVGIGYKF